MSKVKDNYILQGLSGKIGKKLIFKTNKSGLPYTCQPPDRSQVFSSKTQKKMRSHFARAVAYEKSVTRDPVMATTHVGINKSVYINALKDYLQHH